MDQLSFFGDIAAKEVLQVNNKKLGTAFEQEFCEFLALRGYWVHFLSPDRTGSQPFDVIAVKNTKAYCFDCKTCSKPYFTIDRLEQNQIMAFEKWRDCGNDEPMIAIKHDGEVFIIEYYLLKYYGSVNIHQLEKAEEVFPL